MGGLVHSRLLRALVAVTANASALVYGYALWGGVKELYAAVLLGLLAATAAATWKGRVRTALVPAVARRRSSTASACRSHLARPAGGRRPRRRLAASCPGERRSCRWSDAGAGPAGAPRGTGVPRQRRRRRPGHGRHGQPARPVEPLADRRHLADRRFPRPPRQHRATIVLVGVALAACAYGVIIACRRRAWRLLWLLREPPWSVRSSSTSRRGRGSRRRRLRSPRPSSSCWRSLEARRSSSPGVGSRERSSWRRSSAVSRGRMCWEQATRTWRRAPSSRSWRRSGIAMPAMGRP